MAKERILKYTEKTATFGMLLIALALVVPIASAFRPDLTQICKWLFAGGALIYLVARIAGAGDRGESLRLRRLRRMQCWAGIAFGVAAFFWFYTAGRLGENAGPLAITRNTILFSLVGALIQIVSSWMIWGQQKKDAAGGADVLKSKKVKKGSGDTRK